MTLVILSIPSDEFSFLSTLAEKMGWVIETKDSIVDRFIRSCPSEVEITDEEIQKEVDAIRKG